MKQYIVKITEKALADMEEIYAYIAEQLLSPENAMGQYNRIAEAIQQLNVFPERMPIMESEPEHTMQLRQLPIDNFLAFYVIKEDRVIVTRVLYHASDISRRLFEG
ncbi:MAG: type II toxin-antitoxin system RelE/ParE family toxin [Bacteroides sp.]|nr:type II toxin-antitoxin system RelE/ParE family toxin [Bacteroides sp.]MCM1550893.1 type II toxin-antitoxin system RelE/ParE family toxin [Clostridium sp.]